MSKCYPLSFLRRPSAWSLLAALTVIAVAPLSAEPRDVVNLYSQAVLDDFAGRIEPVVQAIVKDNVEPYVNSNDVARLRTMLFLFPQGRDLVGFTSDPAGDAVIIPILSLKFLNDFIYVTSREVKEGAKARPLSPFIYIGLLKYRRANEFPDSALPTPFEAFGITHNELQMPISVDRDVVLDYQWNIRGALVFIISHEIGHVLLNHTGHPSIKHEEEADAFAVSIVERSGVSPGGIVDLFNIFALWSPVPGDPGLEKAQQESPHPLNGARIRSVVASFLDRKRFYPGAEDSDARVVALANLAEGLGKEADGLDNLQQSVGNREVALHFDLNALPNRNYSLIPRKLLTSEDGQRSQLVGAARQALTGIQGNLDALGQDIQAIGSAHVVMSKSLDNNTPADFVSGLSFEYTLLGKANDINNIIGSLISEAKGKLSADNRNSLAESITKMEQLADALKQLAVMIKGHATQRTAFQQQLGLYLARLSQIPGDDARSLEKDITNLNPAHLDDVMTQQKIILSSATVVLKTLRQSN
jgi:hypothetical protein